MLELLEQLFRQVRYYAQSERFDRNRVYAQSPRHVTMQFDRDAEDIIIKGLEESGHGFEVVTEERPTFSTTPDPPYRILVDPIDGTENVTKGIMSAAVALAVLPIDAPVVPERVLWALVGDLFTGTVYVAQKGNGAFRNGLRCQVSNVKSIQHCLAGVSIDGRSQRALQQLQRLFAEKPRLSRIRRMGSAAIDCVYVASGTYDAYIDMGATLTGESFLASACIVLEAGGIVSDHQGKPLRSITNLSERFSLVTAATSELHEEIVARLNHKQP
jgi:myo-inositol-1(or 4)-monophosphatase